MTGHEMEVVKLFQAIGAAYMLFIVMIGVVVGLQAFVDSNRKSVGLLAFVAFVGFFSFRWVPYVI